MDISSGQVFISRNVKFEESTLYHQPLKTKPAKITLEPAEQDNHSDIEDKPPKPKAMVQPPNTMMYSPKPKVQPPKAVAWPRAINSIDGSDDDLTPPPETPPPEILPPKPRRSARNAANVSIAMMMEQGPKTCRAALDAEDAEQLKEAISKEVASMKSHDVFTFIEKGAEGASIIGSRWVIGRKLMANGTMDKWKV